MILDKCSYISTIEEILNDKSKSSKLDIPASKEIKRKKYLRTQAIKKQENYWQTLLTKVKPSRF